MFMKVGIKFFALIVVSLMILGACGTQSQTQVQDVNNQQQAVDSDNQRVESLLSQQDKLSRYIKDGDVSKCTDFEMDPFKETCESTILANRAMGAEDASVCESASSEAIRIKCEFLVESK